MQAEDENYLRSKKLVARSFGAAAEDYQSVNQLQDTVVQRLLERLELMTIKPERVLDLGSGPGTSSTVLAKAFAKAGIFELDISTDMLQHAKKSDRRFFSRRKRLCGDAESLPLCTNSIDLVFSNLMLQWCNNLDMAILEAKRVLRPNGLFIFSTFGPDTLMELRKSWETVDDDVHVNAFIDMHDIGDALIRAGMENPVMESEKITLEYDSVSGLMRDLKTLGAHNVNRGRRKTLTGRSRIQAMSEAYEEFRQAGKLPASYEIIYGHAWLPIQTAAVKRDEHTHTFPVSALKTRISQDIDL